MKHITQIMENYTTFGNDIRGETFSRIASARKGKPTKSEIENFVEESFESGGFEYHQLTAKAN